MAQWEGTVPLKKMGQDSGLGTCSQWGRNFPSIVYPFYSVKSKEKNRSDQEVFRNTDEAKIMLFNIMAWSVIWISF